MPLGHLNEIEISLYQHWHDLVNVFVWVFQYAFSSIRHNRPSGFSPDKTTEVLLSSSSLWLENQEFVYLSGRSTNNKKRESILQQPWIGNEIFICFKIGLRSEWFFENANKFIELVVTCFRIVFYMGTVFLAAIMKMTVDSTEVK